MKCPWTRHTETQTQKKSLDNCLVDTEELTIVTSQFGECVRLECPFFEIGTHYCRRTKM